MGRTIAFPLVICASIALSAGTAGAVTIGDPLANAPSGYFTTGFYLTSIARPGSVAENGSPINGVLTSVAVRTTGESGILKVRQLRLTATSAPTYTFLNVGPDTDVAVTTDLDPLGHITTVATRQPILAGDRLGLVLPQSLFSTSATYDDLTASCASYPELVSPAHPVGTTSPLSTTECGAKVPLVRGTVEPDADADGFGDETQDACPAENARQAAPCTADIGVFARSARKLGKDGTRKRVRFEVLNVGPSVASGITLRITKPSFIGSLSASGCTLSRDRRTCTIASLPSGLNTFVVITVRTKRARAKTSKRRNLSLRLVGLSETDPNATNNDALYALKLRMRPR